MPAIAAAAKPAGTASRQTNAASSPPVRSEPSRRGSRSGRCMPTVSISIAKPTSPRKEIVVSAGSTAPSTAGPTTIPAAISPIITGTKRVPTTPSSGPASPASTITVNVPKSICSR